MSSKEPQPDEQRKNISEKDTNLNSDIMKKYAQESPNNEDFNNEEEEDKPIHFKVEYDKNKNYENQIESSPEKNKNNIESKSPSEKKYQQEFLIEKNNQVNENQINVNNNDNPEIYQENSVDKNAQNMQQFYNILKENNPQGNKQENINNYYYYYLNNYNNKSRRTSSEGETTSKKVVNFATKTYQGRIDPVKLNKTYNNFWERQNKNKNKYKEKMEALQKVFHPNGYNSITGKFKRKGKSQSRYSSSISVNNLDKTPFDNTKAPLPKSSYLLVPYDYGINDPYYGKEDPADYERKKMVKLRMLKQPLRYYYPYTVENFRKRNFKYE